MIVRNPPKLPSSKGVGRYLQIDFFTWLKNLTVGINGLLDFDSNFNSFVAEDVSIAAGATTIITNELSVIPTERMIVRQTGNGVITDGDWTIDSLELTNEGAETVVISVRFFANFVALER